MLPVDIANKILCLNVCNLGIPIGTLHNIFLMKNNEGYVVWDNKLPWASLCALDVVLSKPLTQLKKWSQLVG